MSAFIERIKQRARDKCKTIVLPETQDKRVLMAAEILLREEVCNVILLGRLSEIKRTSPESRLTGATIIDPATSVHRASFISELCRLRSHKGMKAEIAAEQLLDPIAFGLMLVHSELASGLVAGSVASSANVLRPALQIIGTKPDASLVSSFFIMDVSHCNLGHKGLFLFVDCALLESPTADQLANIAYQSSVSFENLIGAKPIVAMLSYSTHGSAESVQTEKMKEATALARSLYPDLCLDGELQADAAIVPSVAAIKTSNSPIEGKANVLVFPDLNSGNIAYKLVQHLAKADAYGPLLQGIAKPVNDLSRGCSVEDIVGVAAITAVQAAAKGV